MSIDLYPPDSNVVVKLGAGDPIPGRVNRIRISGPMEYPFVEYEIARTNGAGLTYDWVWSRFVDILPAQQLMPIGFHTPMPPMFTKLGFCPHCGAPGASRERRPNGNDRCENGHEYPSRDARPNPPTASFAEMATRAIRESKPESQA